MSEGENKLQLAAFTENFREQYIRLLSSGATSAKACRTLGFDTQVPYHMAEKDLSFRDRVSRAREVGVDACVDTLIDLPDTEKDINRARLKCENIRWIASKLKPQQYGDRLDVNMRHSVDLDAGIAAARERIAANQRKVIDITGESGPVVSNDDVVDIFS